MPPRPCSPLLLGHNTRETTDSDSLYASLFPCFVSNMHVTETTDLPTANSGNEEEANPTIEAASNQDTTNSSTRGNNNSTTGDEHPAANETESVTEGYKAQHVITNLEQLLSVAGSQVKLVQMIVLSSPLSLSQKRMFLHMGVMDVLVDVINRQDLDCEIYLQSIAIIRRLLEVGNFDHVKHLVRKGALARIHEIMETFYADDSRFLTISIGFYITMLKLIPNEENTSVDEPVTGNNRDQVTQQVVAILDGLRGPNVLQVFWMRLMHIASLLFEENRGALQAAPFGEWSNRHFHSSYPSFSSTNFIRLRTRL